MSSIRLDGRNARLHDDRNKSAIKKSLEDLGAGRSILIDNSDTAVAGNGVLEQAQSLGIPIRVIETDGTELIAVKRVDLAPDDPKRKALAIADNRIGELSVFDDLTAAELLSECGELSLAAGFTESEIAALSSGGNFFADLVENNFSATIKAESNEFSVTFTFPKENGACVTRYIAENGKAALTAAIITICSGGPQNA